MTDEQAQAFLKLIFEQRSEMMVLREGLAHLMTEVAMVSPNARDALERSIAAEEAGVYQGIAKTDMTAPTQRGLQAEKEEARASLHDLARKILERRLATERGP